jgi:tetratricopeptide (TPR) repeat protein
MRDCGATGTLAALIPPGEKDPGLLLARADADFQCGDFRGAAPVRADLGDCRARGAYEVLLSSDPANAEFATGLARAEEDCGDGDAARKTAGRALALAEGDRALLGRIAALLVRLKDCRGLSVARSLVAAEPGDAEALAGRGRAELTCGTRAAARADFRAAAAARPDDADLRRRLALLEQDAGAYDDELALLNGLLARAPGDAGLLEDRAVALSLSGEPEAAVAGFRAALNADPGRASAWASLAAVLGGLGRRDEALAAYDRALSLPSEDPGLRAAIAKGRAEAASFLTPERGHVSIGPWTPKPLLKRPPPP